MTFFEKAVQLATLYVDLITNGTGALLLDNTLHKPYGAVFFYQSKRYLETGSVEDMFAGNAPFLINHSLELRVTGTARPLEEYLTEISRS